MNEQRTYEALSPHELDDDEDEEKEEKRDLSAAAAAVDPTASSTAANRESDDDDNSSAVSESVSSSQEFDSEDALDSLVASSFRGTSKPRGKRGRSAQSRSAVADWVGDTVNFSRGFIGSLVAESSDSEEERDLDGLSSTLVGSDQHHSEEDDTSTLMGRPLSAAAASSSFPDHTSQEHYLKLSVSSTQSPNRRHLSADSANESKFDGSVGDHIANEDIRQRQESDASSVFPAANENGAYERSLAHSARDRLYTEEHNNQHGSELKSSKKMKMRIKKRGSRTKVGRRSVGSLKNGAIYTRLSDYESPLISADKESNEGRMLVTSEKSGTDETGTTAKRSSSSRKSAERKNNRGNSKESKKKKKQSGAKNTRTAAGHLCSLVCEEWFWMTLGMLTQAMNVLAQLVGPQLIGIIIQCASWKQSTDSDKESFSDKSHPLLARLSCWLFKTLEPRCHQRPMAMAHSCAYAYVLSVLVTCLFVCLSSVFKRFASQNILYNLRLRLFSALVFADIGQLYDTVGTGQLLNRLSNDVTELTDTISMEVTNRLGSLMLVSFCAVYVAFISWKLTLAMLLVFPAISLVSKKFGRYFKRKSKKTQDTLALASEVASETMGQIRTVKAYSKEEWHLRKYEGKLRESRGIGYTMAYGRGAYRAITTFLNGVGIAVMLYLGSELVLDREMGIANFTTFILYSMKMNGQISNLIDLYSSVLIALGSTERVFEEYINNRPLIRSSDPAGHRCGSSSQFTGQVQFRHVDFAYPTRPTLKVLKDFSLTMKPSTTTALCGMSGSGKSTVAKLLLRFYDPLLEADTYDGSGVLIDGVDLRLWDLRNVHSFMAAVTQEPILFNDSIWNNVIYALSDEQQRVIPNSDVIDACVKANCHGFISELPNGYETVVGERGVQLSGGQKQRIAIARALLRNPRILILDEATSALDTESEALVQAALDNLMREKTVLVIAHRLSTVVSADTIVCMKQGKIVEMGNHESLIADPKSYYSYLVRKQMMHSSQQKSGDDGKKTL